MNATNASSSPRESHSYAPGPATFGGWFWKRRAYSCVATEPRLKKAECTEPSSVSVATSTLTAIRCCRFAGSP